MEGRGKKDLVKADTLLGSRGGRTDKTEEPAEGVCVHFGFFQGENENSILLRMMGALSRENSLFSSVGLKDGVTFRTQRVHQPGKKLVSKLTLDPIAWCSDILRLGASYSILQSALRQGLFLSRHRHLSAAQREPPARGPTCSPDIEIR